MWRFLARFRTLAGVVLLLLLPFVFLHFKKKLPALSDAVSGTFLDTSVSFQEAVLWMFSGVSDSLERYFVQQNSKDELFELRYQKHELTTLQILLSESERENQRLRQLLQFSSSVTGPRVVGATVIGQVGTPLIRTVQIDQGTKAGVQKGDAVISDSGAVGQVLLAGKYSSQILLLTDSSSAVDIVVERSRAKGILRGLMVRDFDRLQDIRVGDIVVTSGLGAKFPEGMPVGTISKIRNHRQGLYVEAEIEPFVAFNRLEQVLLLTKGSHTQPWKRREIILETLQMSVKP
ncbi:MAG: rod shape-determining protein MreC [Myxococcaceae bacterium]